MQWTTLDGLLQQKQIDIYERQRGPLFRFVALLHSLYVVDILPWIDDDDAKARVSELLEWPAIHAQREAEASTRAAMDSLRAAGFDPGVVFGGARDTGGAGNVRPQ